MKGKKKRGKEKDRIYVDRDSYTDGGEREREKGRQQALRQEDRQVYKG